jgi:hypothetical protein
LQEDVENSGDMQEFDGAAKLEFFWILTANSDLTLLNDSISIKHDNFQNPSIKHAKFNFIAKNVTNSINIDEAR